MFKIAIISRNIFFGLIFNFEIITHAHLLKLISSIFRKEISKQIHNTLQRISALWHFFESDPEIWNYNPCPFLKTCFLAFFEKRFRNKFVNSLIHSQSFNKLYFYNPSRRSVSDFFWKDFHPFSNFYFTLCTRARRIQKHLVKI